MKFTLNWLKEHLETQASLSEIVEALNRVGLVVADVQDPRATLGKFCVVEILSAEPHPDADRLKVCQVNTGQETLQVVCGAPNARAGLKAVLGRPGMYVPGAGITLSKAKIRGVESHGMMCSLVELGLGEDKSGIIEAPADTVVGTPYIEVIGRNDPMIEIEVTPNRGDCLGVYGIARDLAATGLGVLKMLPSIQLPALASTDFQVVSGLVPQHQSACPMFSGRVIRGVKNQKSPAWLEARLKAVGVKSISALVDVTNFMAYHLNRPMHVFDLNQLKGPLTIRLAQDGETLVGLDEKTHTLDASMLVVADSQGPCGLAGIMGGQASGCSLETQDVFLESAYFDPDVIAITGRKLNIISDSRYRFERGVDPAVVLQGLDMATQMILDLCGGTASQVVGFGLDWQRPARQIAWDAQKVWSLGSVTIKEARAEEILTQLGFTLEKTKEQTLATVPTWRMDMDGPADLVEEVIRLYGYDHITEEPLPAAINASAPQPQRFEDQVRQILTERGLLECQTWSFMAEPEAKLFEGGQDELTLINPISQDLNVMRPSLLPNLLQGIAQNQARGVEGCGLFEIGSRYALSYPHHEQKALTGVRFGKQTPRHWLKPERDADVFDIKADLRSLLNLCGNAETALSINQKETKPWFHPGRSGAINWQGQQIGYMGEMHPDILKHYDIKTPVMAFEIVLETLSPRPLKRRPITFSSFQTVHRDFAFVVSRDLPAQDLLDVIRKTDALVTDISIFDVYMGQHVQPHQKSIAVSVQLEPLDKTLTDAEIKDVCDRIVAAVSTKLQGVLRA